MSSNSSSGGNDKDSLESVKASLAKKLHGIERYNPENIPILEHYLDLQLTNDKNDLEANLALLKLYQFNPKWLNLEAVYKILLKALTNLPATDLVLCKSLLSYDTLRADHTVVSILELADLLEHCRFKDFWAKVHHSATSSSSATNAGSSSNSSSAQAHLHELTRSIAGFDDSVRKFVCHVVSITFQRIQEERLCELLGLVDENAVNEWIRRNGWKTSVPDSGYVLVSNQDESIKTKNITEKIDLESVAGIMASCI